MVRYLEDIDEEKIPQIFSELEDKFFMLSTNGSYIEKTDNGTEVYGNPMEAAKSIDFNNFPDVVIFKNRLIWEADIPLNGVIYPDDILKADYQSLDRVPITPGHVDTPSNEFGIVQNPVYIGKKLYADLVISEKRFAINILKGRKLGLSPTQYIAKRKDNPIYVTSCNFKSLSPVEDPAYDKTFLNNSKMDELENITYDPKKLMDYTLEELRMIVKQLAAAKGYPYPPAYPKAKGEELEKKVEELNNALKAKEAVVEADKVKNEMEDKLKEEQLKTLEAEKKLLENKVDDLVNAELALKIIANADEQKSKYMKYSIETINALIENSEPYMKKIKELLDTKETEPFAVVSQNSSNKRLSVEEQIAAL